MTVSVRLGRVVGGFVEDKDAAREFRLSQIMPALEADEQVIIDFDGIEEATQSFVHALVGEALTRYGDAVLDRIEFKNCDTQVLRDVIELVVDYSLGGFATDLEEDLPGDQTE